MEKFYYLLSKTNQDLFDKIEAHEILGASNHLEIMGNMFVDMVRSSIQQGMSLDESIEKIENLANHYNRTRGNASRAIYNGILIMLNGVDKKELKNTDELLARIENNIKQFNQLNKENLAKIKQLAAVELADFQNILLYDYSSTVEKSIIELANNTTKEINVYLSESSAIDGGRPFFPLNKQENINIKFFPDAALYHNLKKCDCALMGAETFYPDGTGFNTIGSDMVGFLCSQLNIPLYFITPLNKLDIRRIEGHKKDAVYIDYKHKYKNSKTIPADFDTMVPELIGVEPRDIYAYICEEGIIPSHQMFQISLNYDKQLRGVIVE
ncbi:hypothetical protein ACS127_15670 [Amphibacillus sp. Q70]|uniref:hypothetical protein n=1 Tax=Amphibacillus sp. Q70 TaxID=3453416 RepID=UPI003F871DD2